MSRLFGKTLLIAVFIWAALIVSGCSSAENSRSDGDIQIEAQTVPTATPTNTPEPTPEPTGTELPAEIVEPVSPVSPVATKEGSPASEEEEEEEAEEMKLADDSIEPIPGSEAALAAAIADLTAQAGIASEQIKLVAMESMEWNDASLGCPQEGFMYAQVITPGYLIMLEANGQQYEYHTNQNNSVVLCEQ